MKINENNNKMKIEVKKQDYAIVKSRSSYQDVFANIVDGNEITVIIEQDKIKSKDIINIEKDWKIIKFDDVLDFNLVGFIAKISNALAKEKISIFVLSSYSTDYILIKKDNLEKALKVLSNLGFKL
ncbi:MAG: ACT domain-containing protein [Candidatus Pacearchaeota archaeon]|nr:ACT domain-containing protein [Candidatus Pacearchaeota archaeon]